MTVEWYDLAQRLAAVEAGRPVARLAGSAVWPTSRSVAVRAAVRGDQVLVSACGPDRAVQSATGAEALAMLGGLGVRVSGERHTLLTDDAATLPALVRLAYSVRGDGMASDVAAHIGWWADRADFPGTSAVLPLVTACQTRWVTGAAPDAERHAATWRQWLGVRDESVAGLFDLAAQVREGRVLPMLETIADDDAWAWSDACRQHADGWDWRTPDTISRAASGLRSRCDTADLWAAALLDDPIYRRRAVHTGHVVKGRARIPAHSRNRVELTCDRMDARLRAGSAVVGWMDGAPTGGRFSGSVTSTGVNGGRLLLSLMVTESSRPVDGSRVTVMPAPPNPHQTRRGRAKYRALYSTRSSWLTTGRTPTPQRRDVPLDVLLAGAADE